MGVLDGKVALVTGGGQGVGFGIALALAGEGAKVAITGRVESKLEAAVDRLADRGAAGTWFRCDGKVAKEVTAAVSHTVETFGTVDVLVNNAQQTILGSLFELSDDDFTVSWESGPGAALRFMRECHPHLRGGGVILNLGSSSGLDPRPTFAAYSAVKEAMRAITRVAALEWGKDQIRVNALLPLAMTESMVAWRQADPDGYERVESAIALGRFGDPERDIGSAAVYLTSDLSSYVTGTTLVVDGGQTWLH